MPKFTPGQLIVNGASTQKNRGEANIHGSLITPGISSPPLNISCQEKVLQKYMLSWRPAGVWSSAAQHTTPIKQRACRPGSRGGRDPGFRLLEHRYDLFDIESFLLHGKTPFFAYWILPETNSRSGSKKPGPATFVWRIRAIGVNPKAFWPRTIRKIPPCQAEPDCGPSRDRDVHPG